MGATGVFASNCELTDREGMLKTLKRLYSVERAHSVLQIVSEGAFYEDEHIQILKGFCNSNVFYYVLKRSSKV